MQKLAVIKIGGNIIDDAEKLNSFLADFAAVEGYKILVHGGGKIATTIGEKLSIRSEYINGRRVTDSATLELVTMVYGGLINKNIVSGLQWRGCNAIGLTGADGNMMCARKREVKEVDYGYVGDITSDGINVNGFQRLLEAGFVPVVAPITYDGQGNLLNTNADTIAQEIAKAMAATMQVQLIYCFEKKGLLADVNDDDSVITGMDTEVYQQLKAAKVISGGMIPKVDNAFEAIRNKVSTVAIGHADDLHELIKGEAGTQIK